MKNYEISVPVMLPRIRVLEAADFKEAAVVYDLVENLPPTISGAADVEYVSNVMKKAGHLYKTVNKRREELKAPFIEIGRAIDDKSDMLRPPLKEIETRCKEMLARWKMDERLKEQEKHAEALEMATAEGRHTPDLTQEVACVDTNVFTPKVSTRKIPRIRIVDESVIPRKYLVPDMKAIEADAFNGIIVPGIELFTEEIVVNR